MYSYRIRWIINNMIVHSCIVLIVFASTLSRLISILIKVFIRCRMVLVIFCFLQLYADLVNSVFDIWVCVFMLAWDHAKRTFKYFQQPFDGIVQWRIVSVEFYIDLKVVENFIISLICLVIEVLQSMCLATTSACFFWCAHFHEAF